MSSISFKRGDTLFLTGVYKVDGLPSSIDSIDVASEIRNNRGELIDTLVVTKTESVGEFTLTPTNPSTLEWPLSALKCDIQFSEGGIIRSTETFNIVVVQEITR